MMIQAQFVEARMSHLHPQRILRKLSLSYLDPKLSFLAGENMFNPGNGMNWTWSTLKSQIW
jgi:hypothetical protein